MNLKWQPTYERLERSSLQGKLRNNHVTNRNLACLLSALPHQRPTTMKTSNLSLGAVLLGFAAVLMLQTPSSASAQANNSYAFCPTLDTVANQPELADPTNICCYQDGVGGRNRCDDVDFCFGLTASHPAVPISTVATTSRAAKLRKILTKP